MLPSRDWARMRAASSSFIEAISASSCEALDGVVETFCLEWSNFKWSTRSGLKIAAVTDIIISMLQAAGINSGTHVLCSVL